jgi:zinc protease
MIKKWLFLLLISSGLIAAAQPRLPQNYYWQKFDNGLEVVVIENHRVPLATIEIAVKNGAYTEGPNTVDFLICLNICFSKQTKTIPTRKSS